jgi:hypothetical protein
MVVGKYSVACLKKSVEKMVSLVVDSAFTDSTRKGSWAFFAKKGSNKASRFLEMAKEAVGGRHGLIIVPEGCELREWKMLANWLGKVVAVFESSLGKVRVMLPKRYTGFLVPLHLAPWERSCFSVERVQPIPVERVQPIPVEKGLSWNVVLSFAEVVSIVKTVIERFLGLLDKKNLVADGSFGQKLKPKAQGTAPCPFRVEKSEVTF